MSKIIDGWVKKYLQAKQKQHQKAEVAGKTKEELAILKNLKALYEFVNWLNKTGLRNRAEKKTFWRQVIDNKPIMEETLANLVKQYTDRTKVKTEDKK